MARRIVSHRVGTIVQQIGEATEAQIDARVVAKIADDETVAQAAAAAVDAEPRVSSLIPAQNTVVVGGGSGPVTRQLAWPGMEMQITDLEALAPAGDWQTNTWTSYDGANIIVHPSIRYFPEPFSGYHWWAAATPYANSDVNLENPCVYVSEDGLNWVDAPGVTNPLIDNSAAGVEYNSDPYLTMDHEGRLLLYYREQTDTHSRVRLFTSRDGVTWDGPATVHESLKQDGRLVSFSVWWEAREQKWVMLGIEAQSTLAFVYDFRRYTCASPDGPFVEDATRPTIDPAWETGWRMWHPDILPLGNQLIGIVMVYRDTPTPVQTLNFLMSSDDGGRTWTRLTDPVDSTNGKYKSALVPMVTERGFGLHIFEGMGVSFGYNTRSATFLPPATKEIPAWQEEIEERLAASGVEPYVFGDNFNRPDNLTGLGTSSSGHAWTSGSGTMTVVDGKAMGTVGTNDLVTVDVGISDYEISGDFVATAGTGQLFLVLRYGGATSHLRIGQSATQVAFTKVDPTVTTIATSVNLATNLPYRLRVRCEGDTITAYINDAEAAVITEPLNQTSTVIGLFASSSSTKTLDNLTVKRLT